MLELLAEFYKLALQCVNILRTNDPRLFIGAVLAGLTVGGLLWWFACVWGHWWNKKFTLQPLHHILAALALVFAPAYTVTSVGLKYASAMAERAVRSWQESATFDNDLRMRLAARLYDEIAARGGEDMSKIPDPRQLDAGQEWIFTYSNHAETQAVIGEVYTRGALEHFKKNRPLLAAILSPSVTPDLVVNDIRQKSTSDPGAPYHLQDGVQLLVSQMFMNLSSQIGRVVITARLVLLGLFLLFLLIPFSLIAAAAYRDIRVHTPARPFPV